MDGNRFLDWPSSEDPEAIHAGLQAMTIWSLSTAAKLAVILDDSETQRTAEEAVSRLKKYTPDWGQSKQATALMSLTDLVSASDANTVLAAGGAKNFSTFYGYYMLQAMAKASNYIGALDVIRNYWGAMLDLGATTFWEDFNLDWTVNAARIDELVPEGKQDIHGDFGDYCYVGFRHSLCHGWASGPTAWLTEHVLGVKVTAPGSKEISINPNLGDLEYAEGTFPTAFGMVYVKHTRQPNGQVKSEIKAPDEVNIVTESIN